MENQFSFKDFENVRLKATYNIEIGDRLITPGETIVKFDKIQIASLRDIVQQVSANGGFDNRGHVFWTTVQEERLEFSQGVVSPSQFALLNNARLITLDNQRALELTTDEILESDENNIITLKYTPTEKIWLYDYETGAKISDYTVSENEITLTKPFQTVLVCYVYNYQDGGKFYQMGRQLINGFVELEGKTRIKDDKTGQVTTGIIKIPKLRLMSNLSIRLGAQANPIVGNFSGVAVPVGPRGNSYVSEFYFLDNDVDSDL